MAPFTLACLTVLLAGIAAPEVAPHWYRWRERTASAERPTGTMTPDLRSSTAESGDAGARGVSLDGPIARSSAPPPAAAPSPAPSGRNARIASTRATAGPPAQKHKAPRAPASRGQRDDLVAAVPHEPQPAVLAAVPTPMSFADSQPAPLVRPMAPISDGPAFQLNQVDVRPEVTSRVDPAYPDGIAAGRSDVVVVSVLVSAAGTVRETRLLKRSTIDAAFDRAAIAAVSGWRFSPARKRDKAVSCWLNVGVPFRPAGGAATR